jgi:hypothetical protein
MGLTIGRCCHGRGYDAALWGSCAVCLTSFVCAAALCSGWPVPPRMTHSPGKRGIRGGVGHYLQGLNSMGYWVVVVSLLVRIRQDLAWGRVTKAAHAFRHTRPRVVAHQVYQAERTPERDVGWDACVCVTVSWRRSPSMQRFSRCWSSASTSSPPRGASTRRE